MVMLKARAERIAITAVALALSGFAGFGGCTYDFDAVGPSGCPEDSYLPTGDEGVFYRDPAIQASCDGTVTVVMTAQIDSPFWECGFYEDFGGCSGRIEDCGGQGAELSSQCRDGGAHSIVYDQVTQGSDLKRIRPEGVEPFNLCELPRDDEGRVCVPKGEQVCYLSPDHLCPGNEGWNAVIGRYVVKPGQAGETCGCVPECKVARFSDAGCQGEVVNDCSDTESARTQYSCLDYNARAQTRAICCKELKEDG